MQMSGGHLLMPGWTGMTPQFSSQREENADRLPYPAPKRKAVLRTAFSFAENRYAPTGNSCLCRVPHPALPPDTSSIQISVYRFVHWRGSALPPSDEGGAPKGRRERNVLQFLAFSLPQSALLTHSPMCDCLWQSINSKSLRYPRQRGPSSVRC